MTPPDSPDTASDTAPGPAHGSPASPHRVHRPDLEADLQRSGGVSVTVSGPEAHHALRVKRLREGDAVELFDGAGRTLASVYTSWRGSRQNPAMVLEPAGEVVLAEPVSPRVEVFCPPPRAERLGPMIDQLSQIGAAAWVPLATARTQGSANDFKRDKLDRVVVESAKQCRRAWLMEIGEPVWFEQAIGLEGAVLFDVSGRAGPASGAGGVARLFVGPEGGWTADELDIAGQAGVATRRAGAHTLRLETAAVVAATTALHDARPDQRGPA